jgi:hypothetical protein
MTETAFKSCLQILNGELSTRSVFSGKVAGEQKTDFTRLAIGLTAGAALSRDIIEHHIRLAVESTFPQSQIIGMAFCGAGMDELVLVVIVSMSAGPL